ncbi:MAG: hypothetical protein JWN78_2546 [Bacteroidota bacterium]|nr:hypothetical protein [Bacteroidota bacterium]
MTMPKRLFIIIWSIIIAFNCGIRSYAQDYKGAVGGRFGYGIGLTGVYMFNPSGGHGLEFLLRYGYHGLILNKPGINIQVLYEKHWEIGRRGYWTAYIGAGPALGFGKKVFQAKDVYMALGVSPILGIDYTTQRLRIPLILALDYKPTLNGDIPLNKAGKRGYSFSYYEVAFSVRIGFR